MTDRSVLVRLRADVSDFVAKSQLAKAAVKDLNNELDKSNDRTAWLVQGVLALAPAVATLGAGAVPVLSGMATQMTLTVLAAGTMAIAFNGVGDAVGALNDYQLKPTAENLDKLNIAMAKIGPAGQEFVEFLDSMEPALAGIAMTARDEMFPGITDGLQDLLTIAPEVDAVVGQIASAIGQLAADGGAAIAGPRFEEFFEYLETRAKPLLLEMGRTLGNFFDGFTNMVTAFDPMTADFSSGLLDMSRSFAAWSDGLESSDSFQEFVDYVREAGPMALDFLGSMITTLVELAEAAAPVGAVVLPILTGILDVIGDLANTPLGPIVIGVLALTSALGRMQALGDLVGTGMLSKLTGGIRKNGQEMKTAGAASRVGADMMLASWATAGARTERETKRIADGAKAVKGGMLDMGKAAAPVAGQLGLLAFALSDYDDKLGLANTATMTLMGSMLGLPGLIGGAIVGGFLDMQAAGDAATSTIDGLMATAESGNMTKFAAELKVANAELEQFKQDDLTWLSDKVAGAFGQDSRIDEKTAQIAAAEAAARKAASTTARLAAEQSLAARDDAYAAAMERAEDAVLDFSEAVAGLDSLLSKRASMRDYEAAIDAFTEGLKENGRTFDINTDKGRKNQAGLDNIVDSTLRVAESMKGAAKQKFLTTAITDLETMGRKFNLPKSEIDTLIAKLRRANEAEVNPTVKVNALPAFATFRQVDEYMSRLDGSTATTYVNTVRTVTGPKGAAIFGSADGSTVPGQRYPYGDKVHAMVAPGEEIISNRYGQADKNRAALKAANNYGAKLAVIGYAGGGTIPFGGPGIGRPTAGSMGAGRLEDQSVQMLLAAANLQLEAATAQQEAAQSQVDGTKALMASLADATTSGFQTSLFSTTEGSSTPWAAGAKGPGGGWLDNLTGDVAGLQERGNLQTQLGAAGLDGAALVAALSQGNNADLSSLLASGGVQQFEDLFNQRAALTASVGGAAGQQAFGGQLTAEQAALDQTAAGVASLNATVTYLTKTVEKLEKQAEKREAQQERREQRADARADRQAEKTGEKVGSVINGAAANAATGQGRGPERPR